MARSPAIREIVPTAGPSSRKFLSLPAAATESDFAHRDNGSRRKPEPRQPRHAVPQRVSRPSSCASVCAISHRGLRAFPQIHEQRSPVHRIRGHGVEQSGQSIERVAELFARHRVRAPGFARALERFAQQLRWCPVPRSSTRRRSNGFWISLAAAVVERQQMPRHISAVDRRYVLWARSGRRSRVSYQL